MKNVSRTDNKKREQFYELELLSALLNSSDEVLKKRCLRYGVRPCRNESGDLGIYKHDLDKYFKSFYYSEYRPNVKPENDAWLLTVEEAAEMLQTNKRQVQKLILDKVIPTVKVGKETRILYFDLIESTHIDHYLIEPLDDDEDY